MKKIEKDTMPVEVATALLTDPKARMTNRMRKVCRMAREVCYASEAERKPIEAKLRARMHDKPIDRLDRLAHRTGAKRRGLQHKYEAAKRLQEKQNKPNPVIDRLIAMLDLRVAYLDMVTEAVIEEMQWRTDLVEGIIPEGCILGVAAIPCTLTFEPNAGHWQRTKCPDYVPSKDVYTR